MADIDITIAAKDQASQILDSVEKATNQLTRSVADMGKVSQASGKMFSLSLKGIAGIATGVGAAILAVKGVTAAIAGMGDSVEAFNVQEEAARGMTQAQQDFAAALQRSTNVGDEATLMLMRQAEMMGFSKDQSTDLTTAAIGLAESLGISQTEALKKVAQATSGNAGALGEFLPAIRNATTEAEKLAIVNETVNAGLQKLNDDTQTTRGAMERSAGAFGDLKEKVGELLEPLFRVTHQGLAVFAETMQVVLIPAIQTVQAHFGALPLTLDHITKFIVGSITAIEVVVTNLPMVWEMAVTLIALRIEQMRADVEHNFTVVIPAYFKWFTENAFNLLQDYFALQLTVISNFGQKLAKSFSAIFEFITSGFQGGLGGLAEKIGEAMSGSLVDGFEAKTQALPDIAARQMTGAEELLANDLAKMGMNLAGQFSDKFNERMEAFGIEGAKTVDLQLTSPESIEVVDKITKNIASVQALQANEQRLLNRGAAEDPSKIVAENTKRTNEKLDKLPQQIAANLAPLVSSTDSAFKFVEVA